MRNRGELPVYIQLSEMIRREINAGRLLDGERLPPERDMAKTLQSSVGTLRKALADLTEKGMLERRQGSGNYVRAIQGDDSVYAFFRLELPGGGGLPGAKVLTIDKLVKPIDLPPFGTSKKGHRIRRLRLLNQQPVALEEIWLDGSRAKTVTAKDLSESIYFFYKKQLKLWIARVEDRVGISVVPDWAPAEFGMTAGTPCGFIERIGWSKDDESIEFSRSWFDSERAKYVMRMK